MGFIGLMVIRSSRRGTGLGKVLMRSALQHLERRGCTYVGLDAVGPAVGFYEGMGFETSWESLRFGIDTRGRDLPPALSEAILAKDEDIASIIALDRRLMGFDRSVLLSTLSRARDCEIFVAPSRDRIRSFGVLRRSKGCHRMGPVVAETGEEGQHAARSIVVRAISQVAPGLMTVNVPGYNRAMVELLEENDATMYEPCSRMYRGDLGPMGRPLSVWALGAAEKG